MNNRPYSPTPGINDFAALQLELTRIADVCEMLTVHMANGILHKEPVKPVQNQMVFADGTDWNPGNGRGFYMYSEGNWLKLLTNP